MNPRRLTLRGFRSFADLELDLPSGCVGLVGTNGAGKSSLLMAIETALFGARGKEIDTKGRLEDQVRAGSDSMLVELIFEHRGELLRVRREWSRGRTFVSLDALEGEQWEPLAAGKIDDVDKQIVATIGMSRPTFVSSAYLSQGDGGAWTEAKPEKRKKVLGDALALDLWEVAKHAVGLDVKGAKDEMQMLGGRISALAERVEAAAQLQGEADRLTAALADADRALAEAAERVTECEDIAGKAAAAVDVWRRAQQDVTTAEQLAAAHRKLAIEAQAARERLDGERTRLAEIGRLAEEHATKTRDLSALEERDRTRALVARERDRLQAELDRLEQAAARHADQWTELDAKARQITEAPDAVCDRCEQHLPDQARETALRSITAERDAADAALADARVQADAARESLRQLVLPAPVDGLDELRARVAEIQHAPGEHAATRARIEELELTASLLSDPSYHDEQTRLDDTEQQARERFAQLDEPEPGAAEHAQAALLTARAAQDAARTEQARTAQELARVDGQLKATEADAAALDQAARDRAQLADRLADLDTLERAFGRDGIPQWIVETHAIPAIEQEANRLLNTLGGPVTQVELRTERELKGGGLADALDIVCQTQDGARDYATFSGGERTRISLSLRIALSRLLAHRRDADVRLLVLDEPDGLDTAGMEALVDILRGLVQRGDVDTALLASHVPALRDSFDQALIVERDDEQGSKVVFA